MHQMHPAFTSHLSSWAFWLKLTPKSRSADSEAEVDAGWKALQVAGHRSVQQDLDEMDAEILQALHPHCS
jgi:hypothetical protein